MGHLIDRIADTDAVVESAGNSIPCRVREMGNVQCVYNSFGQVQYYKTFLADLNEEPAMPAKLTVEGRAYDISTAKMYRSISGQCLGCRITVVQG